MSITTGGSGNWSSTVANAPWPGGTLPTSADDVIIAVNHTVTLDAGVVAACRTLTLAQGGTTGGTLLNGTGGNISLTVQLGITAQSNSTNQATSSHVHLDMSSDPTHTLNVYLNASANAALQTYTSNGGEIYLRGAPKTRWTKTTSGITGTSGGSIHVADATGWRVGDLLILSATQDIPVNPAITSTTTGSSWDAGTSLLTVKTSTTLTGLIVAGQHVLSDNSIQANLSFKDFVVYDVPSSTTFRVYIPGFGGTITNLNGLWFTGPRTDKVTAASITYDSGSAGPATVTFSGTDYVPDTTKVACDHASGCVVANFTSNLTFQPLAIGSTSGTAISSGNNNWSRTRSDVIKDVAFWNMGVGTFQATGALGLSSALTNFSDVSNNALYNSAAQGYVITSPTLNSDFNFDSNVFYTEVRSASSLLMVASLNTTNAVFYTNISATNFVCLRANTGVFLGSPGFTVSGFQISGCVQDFSNSSGRALGQGFLGGALSNSNFWSNQNVFWIMGGQSLTTLNKCYIGGTPDFNAANQTVHASDTHSQTLFVSSPLNLGSGTLISSNITSRPNGTYVQFQNKNNVTAVQELYTNQSATVPAVQREYAASPQKFTRSTSAMCFTSSVNKSIPQSGNILAENGVAVTIIGYMVTSHVAPAYGTSTLPSISLSGLSITPSTATYVDVSTGAVATLSSVSGNGFHRSSGSFATDGFVAGAGVLVEGFASNNGTFTVLAVTATDITTIEATTAESAGGSRAITRWYKATVTATQSSGADGNLTLTLTSQSAVAGAKAWFSGTPFAPFVSRCRHYGYLYDETVPTRTVNGAVTCNYSSSATISASEATAQAYTGIAVAWGSPSPVTISASTTFQTLYDYTQAQACLNVASALPLTGSGVAGNVSLFAAANLTINTGQVLNGSGSISVGAFTLSTEFSGALAYTYTGGTWSQLTSVPDFSGGTLTLGAENTYTFTATAPIISFAPSANAVTYNLGGGTFSGTLDLRNTHATRTITVQLPAGTSYTIGNNTGAAITVSVPTITQGIDFTGLVAGSQVEVYVTGTQTALYTDGSSGTTSNWNLTYVADKTVDYTIQKAGYVPIRVTGVLASITVLNIGVQQVLDREYVASSGLSYGTTATVNTGTNRFAVTVPTTVQNWYSFMIESWIAQSALANVQFPLSTNGPSSYTLGLDWEWFSGASIAYLYRDGLRYVSSAGALKAVWASVFSSGVPTGFQVHYQQSNGGTTQAAANTGNIDQLIQVYGDASHGNYDYRSWLVLKVQHDGYDQAVADVYATYGALQDQLYVVGLAPTNNGLATGNPSVSSVTITDHGASPVTWHGKQFSVTITNAASPYSGTLIQRWLRYNYGLGGAFQSADAFDWPDLTQTNGTNFKTVRQQIYGDAGATLKGVRVVQNDGTTAHPDFNLFTADDGTTYAPPATATITISGPTAGSRIQLWDLTNSVELYNGKPSFPYTYSETYASDKAIRLRVAYCAASTANLFIDTAIGSITSTALNLSYLVAPVTDTVYAANLIDGTAITDCAIVTNNLHVDINTGSTSWQHIYAFMVYWLSTAIGIADQYLEMTATDQTHYTFSSQHGGNFKIKNVTSPSVPLLITGGNAQPDTGAATDILDTTGGTIFCIEATVVPFTTSSQAVNLSTVQAGIDSRFGFSVPAKVDANIKYVNDAAVHGNGQPATPWGP